MGRRPDYVQGGLIAAPALCIVLASCAAFEPETGDVAIPCQDVDSNPAVAVNFHNDIRPLMDRDGNLPDPGCSNCHYSTPTIPAGVGITAGGLDLTTLGSLRKGGVTSGPAQNIVIAGKPCESAIVRKLIGTYAAAPTRMPKFAPRAWNQQEIRLVIDWIAEGALGGDTE
jgi:hypothetical protein